MDGRAIDDVAAVATLLRSSIGAPDAPIALRGSSMGGYMAIMAAGPARAEAVVAVCPATVEGLGRGLHDGSFGFTVDRHALDRLLEAATCMPSSSRRRPAVAAPRRGAMSGVPVQHSRRAGHADALAGQPLDRRTRRSPPLDPARRRDCRPSACGSSSTRWQDALRARLRWLSRSVQKPLTASANIACVWHVRDHSAATPGSRPGCC